MGSIRFLIIIILSMFDPSFRRFFLLCSLVIAISGSPQSWWWEGQHIRNHRHASCPSCRRERPDTLVSWDEPTRREYRGLEPETSPWQIGQPYRLSPYANPYERGIRGRGSSPFARSAATCKRENPFTIGTDFDFDLAPPQTASIRGMNSLADTTSWYRSLPGSSEPRFSRSQTRTTYQARRPNFYDTIRSQPDSSNKPYPDYASSNDEFNYQSSSNNFKRPYEGSFKRMMHWDDKYFDDTFIQSNPMSETPGKTQYNRGWNNGVLYGRDQVRNQGLERYFQSGRNQYGNSRMTHHSSLPRVKYNSHNLPTDLNALKMVQSVGRSDMEVVNSSRWQKHSEKEEEQDARNYESDENDDQRERGMMDDDYQNNKEFESHEMQQKEINRDVSRGGNSGDKFVFSRNSSQSETSSQTGLELEKITDSARVSEETTTGL
ncbi:uncharacterized protein LOC107996508 isoform X2 [Apis cerana]|uniref:uncharacterized protein LOC107996508 isoform X2 n=1 Tax=Apis cerana TaxID=7461 RepID=UPI0007E2BAD4|nr:uncharacterized protein LOC107996508 isoform X2 [Apis cerana]